MPSPIPDEWRVLLPTTLVVGNAQYTAALAVIFGTTPLPLNTLLDGPRPEEDGRFRRVFEDLRRVIIVVGDGMSAAEVIQCHQAVWRWVVTISSKKEEHELSIIFVLPDATNAYAHGIAVGLSLSEIDPATTGHALWYRSGSLVDLVDVANRTIPVDLVALRSRSARDAKHAALAQLRAAITGGDSSAVVSAARKVQAEFSGHEYQLDVLCCPPSHRHGNLLRNWLHAAVTDSVTPEQHSNARREIATWLR